MISINHKLIYLLLQSILNIEAQSLNLLPTHILHPPTCWGYEPGCSPPYRVSQPQCEEGAQGWPGEDDPVALFYKQADFGFVRERLEEMHSLCSPVSGEDKLEPGDRSSLHCSKDLQFCLAKNIQLDFSSLAGRVEQENLKYRMDIFHAGDITVSGCSLDTDNLGRQLELMSPLQSWAPELQNLRQSDENTRDACDITIDTPTYVVKLDASSNMYHHFCDFFNLYLSLSVSI